MNKKNWEQFEIEYRKLKREIELANSGNSYASDSLPLHEQDFKQFIKENFISKTDLEDKVKEVNTSVESGTFKDGHDSLKAQILYYLKITKN